MQVRERTIRQVKMTRMVWVVVVPMLTACEKSDRSYSLLSEAQSFQQSPTVVDNKLDILFVVDNSGSMRAFQQRLANNFNSFIQNFVTKNYDYHIAVTASDAYLAGANFRNNPVYSRFKRPSATPNFPIISSTTPNPIAAFIANTDAVGDTGSGDERAFSSFKAALENTSNAGFLRPGAFLSVIILSDEDDFSDPNRPEGGWRFGGVADHSYTNPGLETIESYLSYLDQLTGTTDPELRRYNVNAVTVADEACLTSHREKTSVTIIGDRYIDMATATDGVVADLCSPDYSASLIKIQEKIAEKSLELVLNRAPIETTIRVWVNDQEVVPDSINGWTYHASTNSIRFHGTAQPSQGANILVTYDPVAPKQ